MNREITVIGIVKEIIANWKVPRVCILTEDGIFLVKMKAQDKNLIYEIGNKIKATGSVSETRDGFRSLSITGYQAVDIGKDHHAKIGHRREHLNAIKGKASQI
jgi:hypothetical protein